MNKLGIDVGTSTFKYVYLDEEYREIDSGYVFHKGEVRKHFKKLVKKLREEYGETQIILGITGMLSNCINLSKCYYINNNSALIKGTMDREESINSIIELGAQETKYITDINTNSIKFFINSSCSSGTGSFLEEQASRLSIDIQDISSYVERAADIPRIAGRCSVFSKTDMVHYMQEGVSTEDILQGLCYAIARNYKSNVLKRNKINTPVMFAGGVMKNSGVVKALRDILKLNNEDIVYDEKCELLTCIGACKIAEENQTIIGIDELIESFNKVQKVERSRQYAMLKQFGKDDNKNKYICKNTDSKKGYLGIDIGSTSTNFVVIDDDNDVIDYIYTKTAGKPKDVVIEHLGILKKRLGDEFEFKGIGVTGSGREFIGKLINADLIVDEITSQAEGTIDVYEDVDTIFEIGGQDSKYISIEDKIVKDFEMNKICAAGTGAFIEEEIKKIGIGLEEFSDIALKGENPCDLGDRCAVFIEDNIVNAIAQNEGIENISAGLAYSIVRNYLNRVVGDNKIGEKISLQGGIAHNQAIVNAFRAILNKEIIVPKFFDVTGALGAAILVKKEILNTKKKPKRVDSNNEAYDETLFLEGYVTKRNNKRKTIGIPRVIFMYKLFPMFNEMFKRLGFNVLISKLTNEEIIDLSQEYSAEETCYPVKLINGHVAYLIKQKVDYIFLPQLYTIKHEGSDVRKDYACVNMQAAPKIIESVFNLEEKGIKLISPVVSFDFGKKHMIKTLLSIGEMLGKSKFKTKSAIAAGFKKFSEYEQKLEKTGKDILADIREDEKVFIIVSRDYNISDPVLNMGIEDKIKSMGYKVINISNLPASQMHMDESYPNLYWPFAQHLLTGVNIIKNNKNIYAVYITNHGCGPDTIISHYIKKELQGRPYLHLEVDEHYSKTGVVTRIEAFINSLNNLEKKKVEKDEENLIIPYVYPYSHIIKAFLERQEKNIEILEPVSEEIINYGKRFSQSKEYFSLIGITAEVMNKIQNSDKQYTLYLPTNEGSETFGQYGNFIVEKALESGEKLKLRAPFIEDYLKDEDLGIEFYKALIIGDLINLLEGNLKEEKLKKLLLGIKIRIIDDCYFKEFVDDIVSIINNDDDNRKKLLVVGEALVVYKDYLNNNKLNELSNRYKIIKQPLSEMLYLLYSDYEDKKNKTNKIYKKLLKEAKECIDYVNMTLKENSSFNKDIYSIDFELKDKLEFQAGGNGRYRLGKVLTAENVDGILMVSSMYENTAAILKVLIDKYKDKIKVPLIDLYFDSNINKNTDELIETFISYL